MWTQVLHLVALGVGWGADQGWGQETTPCHIELSAWVGTTLGGAQGGWGAGPPL